MRGLMGLAVALALTGGLAACSEEAATPGEGATVEEGGEAAGDVLGGSISDDMIPLEQLTSQSPPLRRAPSTQAASDQDAPAAPSEEGAAPEEAAPSR
jgi:hypothetical protein